MNNPKEKLEISKWLHEQGQNPDYYYDKTKALGAVLLDKEYCEDELQHMIEDGCKIVPYFTLNRVLELLPGYIEKEEIYLVYGCEEIFCKVKYDFGINKKGIGYLVSRDKVLLWEKIKGDTELAALRLLKQVVEAGYLKKV